MSRPYPSLMRWIITFGLAGVGLLAIAFATQPAQSEDRTWFIQSDDLEPMMSGDDPVLDTDDTDTDTDDTDTDTDTDIDTDIDSDVDTDAFDDSEASASQGAGELGGFHCSSAPAHPALWLGLLPLIGLLRRRR